jgi:hypothetical protein
MILRPVLALALALTGCKLLDQTTFAPSPEAKTAAAAVPQVETRSPLVVIRAGTPPLNYQDPLRFAVRAAEARDPTVEYDVIAMLPAPNDVAQSQRNAADVMRAIVATGVPPRRVHLGLRIQQALAVSQVRVYVR